MPNWTIKEGLYKLFSNYKKIKKCNTEIMKPIHKCESIGYFKKKIKGLTHVPIFCAEPGFSINDIRNISNSTESSYVNVYPIGNTHIIKYLKKNNNKPHNQDRELSGFIFNLLLYKYLDTNEKRDLLDYICRVSQIGYISENNTIYCIMHKCGIDLLNFLNENIDKLISLSYYDKIIFLLNLIKQCAIAIKIIHDLGYVHLDIKLENFLIVLKNGNINDYQIKIIDFGFILQKGIILKNRRGSGRYINKIMKNNIQLKKETEVRNLFDIYSLGIMFLKIIEFIFNKNIKLSYIKSLLLISRKNSFFNNNFEINDNNISRNIFKIIDKMTTDKIDDRYNNIDDLINDINNLLEFINQLRQNMY